MLIKIDALEGARLNWAVAKCEGEEYRSVREYDGIDAGDYPAHNFCTDWAQAGPIIERESISIYEVDNFPGAGFVCKGAKLWEAGCVYHVDSMKSRYVERKGPTQLVAAMRAYVSSRFGEEIEVPSELS
jgi:Protein of unknown function (DUF2591)